MGKKIGIIVGLLVIIGGLVWWFVLRTGVTPTVGDENTTTTESTSTDNSSDTATTSGSTTTDAGKTVGGTAGTGHAAGILPMDEAGGVDDMEDSDYSEPVDKEDFADFVNAAIEELESDEVMANAIVTEMVKILEAQPALEEEGVRFYRQCLQKTKVAASVKDKCSAELKKRGLE